MYVCNKCKVELSTESPEGHRSFPAYTVIGGIVGTIGTALSSVLLLVPVALIAGAVVDVSIRHCSQCDKEIEEDEPAYQLMEELGNSLGGPAYRAVDRPSGRTTPNRFASNQMTRGSQPCEESLKKHAPDSLDVCGQRDEQLPQGKFVFDEAEGKLVQQQEPSEENHNDLSLSNDFDTELTMGFETHQSFEIDDSIGADPADLFSDFQNDRSLDVNPFGLIDEPPLGEL